MMDHAHRNEAVPCLCDEEVAVPLLRLLEIVCRHRPPLRWDRADVDLDGEVKIEVGHGMLVVVPMRATGGTPSITLYRKHDAVEDASPLALLSSWRDSLRLAVDGGSVAGRAKLASLRHAASLLVAAGVASGHRSVTAVFRSIRHVGGPPRFLLGIDGRPMGSRPKRLQPSPSLVAFLERTAPPFRTLTRSLDPFVGSDEPCGRRSSDDMDPVELMRLIAALPPELLDRPSPAQN